ncbi:MAG: NAD(+)/NADH kinase [Erysipelotrichaceae bacterium]|nr:NAD(+)/NADH kinase [Erysipelotrichaceae bacterium]MBQ4252891.1 NAD(+)/NADH kinase [Erysipelotrichaceae bacterium]
MKLFIFAGTYTDKAVVEGISAALKKAGHCICDEVKDADLIVSLGGDGTLLKAAQLAITHDKVLTGVNCGRLGYLCLLKQEEIADFDQRVKDGVIAERTLLSCPANGQEHLVINDVVVGKTNQGQSSDLDLWVDGEFRYNVRSDGLIICTPTGSSAYNLAASGPLLEDDTGVFAVTPICPHSKGVYPLVVADDRDITVSVKKDAANIYADGVLVETITDSITVRKAARKLRLLVKRKGQKNR